MQDLRTGDMIPLDVQRYMSDQRSGEKLTSALQQAMDAKVPREFQGAAFQEGEIIEIRGGKFRVDRISPKRLILRGVAP